MEHVPYLSIVIPAFNEAQRLPSYLREIQTYFRTQGREEQIEVIVVDDGSHDGTSTLVESLRDKDDSIRLIRLPSNHGKGYAVRTGMLSAQGQLCLFADADGATPIRELAKLETRITDGAEIAIGSRALHDPACVLQARWYRKFLGRLFHRLVLGLGIKGIADTQCGFKLFQRHAARDLFSALQLNGYGFDVELLFVAQRRRYHIAEVAVNWADQADSKVHMLKDGLRMIREVWNVRNNYLRGLYTLQKTSVSSQETSEESSSLPVSALVRAEDPEGVKAQ